MERIHLAKPYWDDECEQAAINALSSGRWVKGPQAKSFGEEFAKYCGAVSAVPCQSGSAALWAAMRLLDIGPGDEVIVPGMTFIATATSVSLAGATPVFADIEEDYWCICPDDVEAKITERTKAVIGVHIFGQPFSPRIERSVLNTASLWSKMQLKLMEQALMESKREQLAISLVSPFSLSKNMAVGGEGGMITTTRTDLADKMSRIVDHGRNDKLESIEMGTNLRMSEVSAAIGRIQLKHLEEWTTKRRKNANSIKHQTKIRTDSEHAWHQLCILSDNPKELISKFDEAGIDARVHYPIPCNRHQVYSDHFQHNQSLHNCERIAHRLVAIPVHPSISQEDIERINSVLNH